MVKRKKSRGQSMLEFTTLTIFLLATFLIFQKYIARGFTGRWKGIGDSLGQGRIYDPKKSSQCVYDFRYTQTWYDVTCFEEFCEDKCLRATATPADCTTCIEGCWGECAL